MKHFIQRLTLLCLLVTISGFAQTHTVSGKVVAFKRYALNKVKISAKKANTVVYTDTEGNFTITCNKKDHLVFNAAGFHNQKFKLKGEKELDVNLIAVLEESAYRDVVRFEHLSKEKLQYGLDNFLEDNNNFDQLATIYDVIQFVYPQAKVVDLDTTDSAEPGAFGATGPQIILDSRGVNSINSSLYALLVVDGIVINDISGVHPIEVKTCKVLMGNEAGHWGMRGGNGVVEITTKYQ
ncbi:carboxypeptidase-like regulatory domain-containing protein [Seonamhaeicola marinus]|nr:carboxypeptidase-like regulatory domain-containing protein [Seonamhaeicola marinus]